LNLVGLDESVLRREYDRVWWWRGDGRRVAGLCRLGLARSNSDLGSATGRAKGNRIAHQISAAVTGVFHFFTLQEAASSWQTREEQHSSEKPRRKHKTAQKNKLAADERKKDADN
jgi:hypothetical protein